MPMSWGSSVMTRWVGAHPLTRRTTASIMMTMSIAGKGREVDIGRLLLPCGVRKSRKTPPEGCVSGGSDLFHRLGLRPFGALGDVKLDLVAFSQGFEARGGNGRVMDEDVRPLILRNEPKPFLVVEPLDGSMSHNMILLAWGREENVATHVRKHIKKPCTGVASPWRSLEVSQRSYTVGD